VFGVAAHDARATVTKDGMEASGDSIMGLLMLAAAKGSTIDVRIRGSAAEELADALEALIEDCFGEGM
jgi:phosphocarrier protein